MITVLQIIYGLAWLYIVASRFPSGWRTISGNAHAGDRKRTAFWFMAFVNVGFVVRWLLYPDAVSFMVRDELAMWAGLYLLGAATPFAVIWANGIEDAR